MMWDSWQTTKLTLGQGDVRKRLQQRDKVKKQLKCKDKDHRKKHSRNMTINKLS